MGNSPRNNLPESAMNKFLENQNQELILRAKELGF